MAHGTEQVSKNAAKTEAEQVEHLAKPHSSAPKPTAPKPGPPGGGPKPGQRPGPPKPGPVPRPPAMRPNNTKPKVQGKPLTARPTKSDPVDIATGDVLFPQTDVGLDAALPLVLSCTHLSSYRLGGWYGPSWASTLDQRVELDDEGVLFAAEDGMLLSYPVPEPGGAVLPVEGPRWPLHWDATPGGGMRITDPRTGLTRHFAEPAEGPGPHAWAAGTLQLPLHAITDRNGHRVEVVYGSGGVPVEVRHSGGYRIGVTTEGSRITALGLLPRDGAEGEPVELVRLGYDGNGHLATVTDSSRLAMSLTYDGSGRLTGWTDRVGHRYRYVYDRAGRCVQTRGDGGYLDAVFAYDTEQGVTTMTDAVGDRTVYQFDEAGRLARETSPHGAVATFEWDRYGALLSRTDPLGRTSTFSYDADGNLAVSMLPDGTTSSASYNERHQVTELTAMDGAQWRYEYDEQGNTTATVDPMGARTAYTVDDHGRPVAVTDALGNTSRVAFDAAGLTTSLTDSTGAASHSTRDAFGRLSTVTDALGNTTSFGWTLEGRPAWRQDPDGGRHEWTHDAEGRVVAYRDPSGGVTRAEYGPFGKLTARTGADGDRYTFEYDGQLRLVAVTNPTGARWTYRHDPTGGVVEETDFAGRTIRYERDLTGALTARTNAAGQRVEYVRDARGRTVELHADGRVTRFTYDGAGRVLTVGELSWQYTWDSHDQLTSVALPDGTLARYRYDPFGRRRAKQLLAADRVTVLDETVFTWANERLVEQVRTRADRPGQQVTAWEWTLTGQRPLTQTDWLLPAADAPQHEIDRRFHAIVTDLVGTPTELVDEHGTVSWQQRTTRWGSPLPGGIEDIDCPLRFPGQYHDAETGLHYNVFRYYDPATARYLSSDPLGLAGGPNPYGYVHDPRRITDPLGLDPDMIDLYHGTTHAGASSVEQNGINPQHKPRPMDFGHGGFYLTDNPKQAHDWANTQHERYPDQGGPAVMHFQISRSELEALNGKRFNNEQELADFIAHHRNDRYGRQMHSYDNVEGKMLLNLRPWQADNNTPMRLRGHQIAFYQQPGIDLLSNGYAGRHHRR
ncbi:RHS repeat-associated core domain-containing protein [Kitasatospora sp. NPDC056138]|uniref:RHS repeat-associated core domain-containing protein n=1 Tax=Kitasatospora sp. NPDC056138 TaxID=3345724 RepID=UPI0035D6E284